MWRRDSSRSKRDGTHEEGEVKRDNKQEREAEEDEAEKATKKQRSEEAEQRAEEAERRSEEDEGTDVRPVRLIIRKKVCEDMLTVAEFWELEAAEENPNCTREIFLDEWVDYPGVDPGVIVRKFKVVATTVSENDALLPDMTIQQLLGLAYPGDPNPPTVINLFMQHPDGLAPPGFSSTTTCTFSA